MTAHPEPGRSGEPADAAPAGGAQRGGRPVAVLTLGKFDGVHAGHRHLLAHLVEEAGRIGALSVALVLHPDPVSVLTGRPVGRLASLDERTERLRACGVDIVEPLHFGREVAQLDPEMFLAQVTARFAVRAMVVGSDFAFGYNRAGTVERLTRLGDEQGFAVRAVPPLIVEGARVSSRRVRACIAAGDIDLARALLRGEPRFSGTVVRGAARGRTLGYPTANLDPDDDAVVPADGIYTVKVEWQRDGHCTVERAGGVASIGVRPTFDHGPRIVEAHLLDFRGDLYGARMTIDVVARQRGEERFASAADLVAQMDVDAARARLQLAAEAAPAWESATEGPNGIVLAIRGRDLADLCQHLVEAAGAQVPGETDAGTGGASEPVAMLSAGRTAARAWRCEASADGDDGLWRAWLAIASEHAGHGNRAMVYQAGQGQLHAVWTGSGRKRRRFASLEALDDVHAAADGRLEATVRWRT